MRPAIGCEMLAHILWVYVPGKGKVWTRTIDYGGDVYELRDARAEMMKIRDFWNLPTYAGEGI